MSENVSYYTLYLCPSSSLRAPKHASEKKRSKLALRKDFQSILQIEAPGEKRSE